MRRFWEHLHFLEGDLLFLMFSVEKRLKSFGLRRFWWKKNKKAFLRQTCPTFAFFRHCEYENLLKRESLTLWSILKALEGCQLISFPSCKIFGSQGPPSTFSTAHFVSFHKIVFFWHFQLRRTLDSTGYPVENNPSAFEQILRVLNFKGTKLSSSRLVFFLSRFCAELFSYEHCSTLNSFTEKQTDARNGYSDVELFCCFFFRARLQKTKPNYYSVFSSVFCFFKDLLKVYKVPKCFKGFFFANASTRRSLSYGICGSQN